MILRSWFGRDTDSKTPQRPGDCGFTLVEFLVASGASLLLMTATFTFLGTVFGSTATMQQVMDTQQKTRVALNEIAREAVRAGTGLPSTGIAIPNGANSQALLRGGPGVNLGNVPTPNNVLSVLSPGDGVGPAIAGLATDAITILTIDQNSPLWNTAVITPAGSRVDWVEDISAGAQQLSVGDLLLFTNINASVFGQVTAVQTTGPDNYSNFTNADPLNLNQPTAANGNITSLENAANPGTFPPTTATRVRIVTYFLDNTDVAHPKLMRRINSEPVQVVAEDIYNLQFSYDLFDFNTSIPTANQTTTNAPNQIRAISIFVDGRSSDINIRTNDYFRSGLSSKVNARNSTFRNRYTP